MMKNSIKNTADHRVNPLPLDDDYCRYYPLFLVDQIPDIGSEMGV